MRHSVVSDSNQHLYKGILESVNKSNSGAKTTTIVGLSLTTTVIPSDSKVEY